MNEIPTKLNFYGFVLTIMAPRGQCEIKYPIMQPFSPDVVSELQDDQNCLTLTFVPTRFGRYSQEYKCVDWTQ